jgi:hypothetical protein
VAFQQVRDIPQAIGSDNHCTDELRHGMLRYGKVT